MTKILLVDDTVYFGTEIQSQLVDLGYTVEYMLNGADIEYKIDSFSPDIIFLDIDLGVNQSGIEICEMLTKKYPGIIVVLISSHVDAETREKGIRAGAKAFVGKPLTVGLLEAYLKLFVPSADVTPKLEVLYPDLITLSGLKVSFHKRLLFYPNNEVAQLSPIISNLLRLLVEKKGEVVTMSDIIENQWGGHEPVNAPQSIYTAISTLRNLLLADEGLRLRTLRGQGYSLISE